jgi:hypothetical protein
MKKVLVYFLLFIFIIQTTKGLWIITSFQLNKDYIAANLCINRFDQIPTCKGQCFLNNQLNKEQKENKKNLSTIEKDSLFISPQFTEGIPVAPQNSISKNSFGSLKTTKYTSFILILHNPPELVS